MRCFLYILSLRLFFYTDDGSQELGPKRLYGLCQIVGSVIVIKWICLSGIFNNLHLIWRYCSSCLFFDISSKLAV